jgi:hypothetical protein
MATETAAWPIRVGGEYPVKGRAPLCFRVVAIDGDIIHFDHFDPSMSEEYRTHSRMEFSSESFRWLASPEDQSPIPELVEALKEMYLVFAEQERGFDYLLGKNIPTVIANAKAALIKAGVQ